jgi:hypothetical protein
MQGVNDLPKKLKFSGATANGEFVEWGTMEWDGEKWFISGEKANSIRIMVGTRGLYFAGKIFTLHDRGLFLPLLNGYSQTQVEVIE